MKKVTVIIPNYNGHTYLGHCLNAIYKHSEIDLEVLVVDNGSDDDSVENVRVNFPQVKVLQLEKNYGFSRAVNEGIKAAKTPYVFLLNNDTQIQRHCVENLLNCIETSEDIFSVEAKLLQYHQPDKIDSAGTFYHVLGWAFARGNGNDASRYSHRCDCFAACAGAAMYRRELLLKLGLFDESFFAYLEDIDLGYRAKLHGYRNVYEPTARVYHVGSGTSGSKYNEFKVRLSARNNMYLVRKNMPVWQRLVNTPFLLLGCAIKALFFARKGFGKDYIIGLSKGIFSKKKWEHSEKNISRKTYGKIQWELWKNLGKKRW